MCPSSGCSNRRGNGRDRALRSRAAAKSDRFAGLVGVKSIEIASHKVHNGRKGNDRELNWQRGFGRRVSRSYETWAGIARIGYEVVLAHELRKKGLTVERQRPMPIVYDGVRFDEAFRADLVDAKVIAELKSVETTAPFMPSSF